LTKILGTFRLRSPGSLSLNLYPAFCFESEFRKGKSSHADLQNNGVEISQELIAILPMTDTPQLNDFIEIARKGQGRAPAPQLPQLRPSVHLPNPHANEAFSDRNCSETGRRVAP
jgi:hypothetical protein